MAFVPAGPFEMGSEEGGDDEAPVHTVDLDAFYIDVYEATNAQYARCLDDGDCDPPSNDGSFTRDSYFGDPAYDDYPVIYVSWHDAQAFCEWRGARLPSEAEWEKAARVGLEGAEYPWGDEAPVCRYGAPNGAKFDDNADCDGTDTEPVGSYSPNGYGLYDMAGNVWEWVSDWYDVYPGGDPGASDYFGQTLRVLRGGSWLNDSRFLRSASRYRNFPDSTYDGFGFRCARSP
jgi:serine/threonine-protein kinase